MSFPYIPVASKLHDRREVSLLLEEIERGLREAGGRRMDGAVADGDRVAFHFIQTGGVEGEVIRRYRSRAQQGRPGPMLLIAHPLHNSLPAALEILAQIRQEGGTGRIYLLRGAGDAPVLADLAQTADCLEANARLASERLGRVGESSDWLVASSQRAEVVASRFGLKVVPLEIAELREAMAREPAPEQGPEFEAWTRAASTDGVSREAFARAVAVYRGLRAMVERHRLSAVTVRCFDLLGPEGMTGCLALSRLADEGISAGCEGDIPSVILLRWLWHLTGRAGWMANPSDLDAAKGEILLAHCTVPLGLVESHRILTHFESGLGIGLDGTFRTGPVTLLRLGGAGLDRWWGAEGTLFESRHDGHLCRTQVRVRVPSAALAELLRDPLGNHVVLIKGHVKSRFREAFDWIGAATASGQKDVARVPGLR